jgi:hypothetical protein
MFQSLVSALPILTPPDPPEAEPSIEFSKRQQVPEEQPEKKFQSN